MNRLRFIAQSTFTIALGLTAQVASAQASDSAPPVALMRSQEHRLRSAATGRDYRIMVALPQGYGRFGDSRRYSVLYVLDGNDEFPIAAEAQRMLRLQAFDRNYPDIIIVGIGYPADGFMATGKRRLADYTPTAAPLDDPRRTPPGCCEPGVTGEGSLFLRFLRDEVIPLIDRSYQTSTDRGLMGHSLGGLFTVWALFETGDLFSRFAVLSPSLWWDASVLFSIEERFANRHTELRKRVFIAAGALEFDSAMVQPMLRMAKVLTSRRYKGLELQQVLFPDEYHTSVIPAAMSRALRFLYHSPRIPGR